jgi:L-ascorbate metabolism protein UlaG (beta-lactamase superfamily)
MLREVLCVLVPVLLAGSSSPRPFAVSDHCDGYRFYNPGIDIDKSFVDLWRMLNSPNRARWPEHVDNGSFPPPPRAVPPGEIAVTPIGQATVLIQFAGLNVLTDPTYSKRASPLGWVGPKRARDPGVAFEALPRIDVVALSHNHYDHMDMPTLRRLRDRWDPLVVAGLGNARLLASHGLEHVTELDWWQSIELRPDVRLTFVPAQHWSGRAFGDRRRMLWGGYWFDAPGGRVYFAGDTGYPAQFREIRRRLGAPTIALLPIGAYEPRWFMAPQHVNPEEAVRAHLDLGARLSIGMHFATFHQLSDEAMDAPVRALAVALQGHDVSADAFRVLGFGETLTPAADPEGSRVLVAGGDPVDTDRAHATPLQ